MPIFDLGNDDRSYLMPEDREAEVVNRRTVALMALWVVYHRPLLCLRNATRWMGCLGAFRARMGCNSAWVGRTDAGNCCCTSFAACRHAALSTSVICSKDGRDDTYLNTFAFLASNLCIWATEAMFVGRTNIRIGRWGLKVRAGKVWGGEGHHAKKLWRSEFATRRLPDTLGSRAATSVTSGHR